MVKSLDTAPEAANDRVDLRLRLVAVPNTVAGKVLRHLKDNPNLSPKQQRERVIDALCTLWLPYACEDLKDGDARQAARDTIYLLERHIDRLRRDFGLYPPAQTEQSVGPSLVTQVAAPIAQAATTPMEPELQREKEEPPEPEPLDPSFYQSLDIFEN